MKKRVIFVTGNANKLAEVQAILTEEYSGIVPELQGERDEIARAKCEFAVAAVTSANDRKEKENIFVVTEDTSLCFNALNELPGPYIKHFLQRIGLEGLNKLLEGFSDKSAYAICTLAVSNGSEVKIIEGKILGRIVAPRGPKNFGWDPIFQPEGYDETFAEMSKEVKNNISHRSKAFNALKEWFKLT